MGLLNGILTTVKRTVAQKQDTATTTPSTATRLMEEGLALEQQGRFDVALERYEAALALAPTLARAHFKRGNILLDRGDAQEALQAYTKAIQFKPGSAATLYNIGNCHMQLGDLAIALDAYQQAIALKPDFADAHSALKTATEMQPQFSDLYFQRGLAKQDAEDLVGAKDMYAKALLYKPNHVDALNNLGTILVTEDRLPEAIELYRQALAIDSQSHATHVNLGIAQQGLGRLEDAAQSFRQAIQINPSDASTYRHLGDLLMKARLLEEAASCFSHALTLKPEDAQFAFSQGLALQGLKQFDTAAQCYRKAIALSPHFAEAHCNLGAIEKQKGNLDAAIACFQQAIDEKPDFSDAYCNLGNALQATGKLDAAEQSYLRALQFKPDSAIAHCNYGTIFQARGLMDQAKDAYMHAIGIDPNMHDAHNNLGIVQNATRQFTEAIASFHRALDIKPDFAPAHVNLGTTLKDIGRIDEALANLRKAMDIDPTNLQAHHNLLFILNYLNDHPPAMMRTEAERFGAVVERLANPFTIWLVKPDLNKLLRIGFVSGDLCSHPVGYFLISVLEALTRDAANRVELYAYSARTSNDETNQQIQTLVKCWRSAIGLSDSALAHQIREDKIDILFDLSGHTANSRLAMFAWKPAPVQVSWLGYFATTGVAAVDYFLADPWTLPASEEAFFTEQIWRLPETRLCFTAPDANVDVAPLPALLNGHITFGCFNNLTKMNDAVIALWARILLALPHSKLFLKSQQIGEQLQREDILVRFSKCGVAADRLILEDYGPRAEYLAAYNNVDIGLDPFPFPGGTTTVEALWMGIPVLTMEGSSFIARQGVGLIMNAGLPQWIAKDPEDYVAKALGFASDLSALAALRSGLRQQVIASPIFDAPRFADHFQAALRAMWHTWCTTKATKQQLPEM